MAINSPPPTMLSLSTGPIDGQASDKTNRGLRLRIHSRGLHREGTMHNIGGLPPPTALLYTPDTVQGSAKLCWFVSIRRETDSLATTQSGRSCAPVCARERYVSTMYRPAHSERAWCAPWNVDEHVWVKKTQLQQQVSGDTCEPCTFCMSPMLKQEEIEEIYCRPTIN